jgi:predicted dehydrogenase
VSGAPLRLGLVGAGRFATFLAESLADLPDVRIVAVADADPARGRLLAGRLTARAVGEWLPLIDDPGIDAIVVATPPDSHARIALAALDAGRHVFCEKPLATQPGDAARVAAAVASSGRVLVVDHVLRYNPVLRCVQQLRPLLGAVQRLSYENDASDEDLADDHWFWDEHRSGGIFVEHGVHSFDAASMLLGSQPTAVSAMSVQRPDSELVDGVAATALHPGGVLSTYTHSFAHASRCERQVMRLDHGAAQTLVSGWIPVRASIDLWTGDAGAVVVEGLPDRAAELLRVAGQRLPPGGAVRASVDRNVAPGSARGRGRPLHLPHRAHVEIDLGGELAKPQVYAASVRAAMADLAECARTGARPVAGVEEGLASVVVADAARRSAALGRTVYLPRVPEGPGATAPPLIDARRPE